MAAPKGNDFWKNRMDMTADGRKLSVEQVKTKIAEYIERCVEDKLYSPDWVGKDAHEVVRPHMISMSIYGAAVHLGIDYSTWMEWRKDEKYSNILTRAETIFKSYNIEGSAAGMLNQSIIARLEGLTEKQDLISSDGTMTPRLEISVSNKKAKSALEQIANGND